MAHKSFWKGKSTIVSGGSSGFGFILAQRLVSQGANVVLIGRDQARLATACQSLQNSAKEIQSPSTIDSVAVDVSQVTGESLARTLDGKAEGLDLLANAIGQSDRGWLLDLTDEELVAQFRTNVLCSLHMIQACRMGLAQSKGCIVNIGSLASLFATRGLGGYAVTKFGLAAATEQLGFELEVEGIHCMLVAPGPIRVEGVSNRYEQLVESRGLNADFAKPGSGAKIKGLDPFQLADEVLRAAAFRKRLLIRPKKAKWLRVIHAFSPQLGRYILKRFTR